MRLARPFAELDPSAVTVLAGALPRLAAGVRTEAGTLGTEAQKGS